MLKKKESLQRAEIFGYGAAGYASLEILARGHTHWSMALAGGCCLLLMRRISRLHRPVLVQAALCALGVTGVEFAFGAVFNLWLRQNVWSYSAMPGNLLGQVCPQYTLLWAGLSLPVLAYFSGENSDDAGTDRCVTRKVPTDT